MPEVQRLLLLGRAARRLIAIPTLLVQPRQVEERVVRVVNCADRRARDGWVSFAFRAFHVFNDHTLRIDVEHRDRVPATCLTLVVVHARDATPD